MNNKINYNDKYILIVSNKKDLETFKYSFRNILLLKNGTKELERTSKFIKNNNFNQIIFVDFNDIYTQLINSFEKEYIKKVIFTKELGTFSNESNLQLFNKIYELYSERVLDEIGFLDKSLYDTFKNKITCSHILLDREEENKLVVHDDTISIINDPKNNYHSFYNSLSALSLTDKSLKIENKYDKTTKNFMKVFNIKNEKKKNKIEKSLINLYVNFSDNDNLEIIKSFDNDIIPIVGNTSLFDNSAYLKNKIVLKSDDDINEIKSKIEDVLNSKEKIFNEYKKFRKEYSLNSKKSILKFTNEIDNKEKASKNDYLISTIVTVYNSEAFLEQTIESILKARVRDMEIIFVNDGSTDKSEEIILNYQKKYPNLIKYFKQANQGPGGARNLGLKNAKGKYISSVDSDDQIDKNFYKSALKYLRDDIDMVVYDWKTYDKGLIYDTPAFEPIFKNKSIYEGILFGTTMPQQCSKIIKRSIYNDMKLTYGQGKFEDLDTNAIAFLNVKKFKYLRKPYYKYFIREGSVMRSKPRYDMINAIKLLDERLNKYKEYVNVDLNEYKYYLYSWRIEEYIINTLYDFEEKERNQMIDYMMKNIKSIMTDIFDSELYKEMLERQPEDKKSYLEERNKSIKSDKLKNFMSKKIKEKSYKKITPVEMLYM